MTETILRRLAALLLAAILSWGASAQAHVVLTERQATAGTYFKIVLRVPHGCGESPTTGLRVEIPADIFVAKPMPKTGWEIDVERAPIETPHKNEGHVLTERVRSVTWRGGPLPADQFDEFSLLVRLPDQAGPLAFPTIQTCVSGDVAWTSVPSDGEPAPDPKHPAPILTVTAP